MLYGRSGIVWRRIVTGKQADLLHAVTEKYDKDHKISFPYGTDDYWEMMSWLMFQMGGVGPMQLVARIYITLPGLR